MVWTGWHSHSGLITVREMILKPGVRSGEMLLEAGKKENYRAGFHRGSVMSVEGKSLSEVMLQEGSLEISTISLLSSLHPSPLLLLLIKPTRNQSVRPLMQWTNSRAESRSARASNRYPAQTFCLKPICMLETQRNEILSTLDEAAVNKDFEER